MSFKFLLSLLLAGFFVAVTDVSGQIRNFCATPRGQTGQCRPLVKCVRFFHEIAELQRRPCPLLATGEKGVCCPYVVIGTACKS